jgi:cytochrome P450
MREMIEERQASDRKQRDDLFSNLLNANNEDDGDARLTISELIGMRSSYDLLA